MSNATNADSAEADVRNGHALIGSSAHFLALLEQVSLSAPLQRPVLILGERGTGKELIAERLHYLSKRWDQALIKLNCAALNDALLESELFGYEPGAFTGATKRHPGRFELAHKGTLFLDELATMSARLQEKLLRVLEYGEFERLGGRDTIKVNVRVIAATHADLPAMVERNEFRADLLDRLAFEVLCLPPLRERSEDILPLAEHYALQMTRELKRDYFAGFSVHAQQTLLQYHWPGNVRELKNAVERAVCHMADVKEAISHIELNPFAAYERFKAKAKMPLSSEANRIDATRAEASADVVSIQSARTHGLAQAQKRQAEEAADDGNNLEMQGLGFEQAVARFEQNLIQDALRAAGGHQQKAAERLQLSYHQFRGLLRKYEIESKRGQA